MKLGEFLNGGQLIAVSSGAGNAGKITVNATDKAGIFGIEVLQSQLVNVDNLIANG
ncbi:MAG: hypothetical protein DSM106950_18290 [Stigonema ocellatum SAG 48.90 = DSM 106950]|nr:hypothetical protein [Stigonema ocellatum SAG 48.90 = DSM 106950]